MGFYYDVSEAKEDKKVPAYVDEKFMEVLDRRVDEEEKQGKVSKKTDCLYKRWENRVNKCAGYSLDVNFRIYLSTSKDNNIEGLVNKILKKYPFFKTHEGGFPKKAFLPI